MRFWRCQKNKSSPTEIKYSYRSAEERVAPQACKPLRQLKRTLLLKG